MSSGGRGGRGRGRGRGEYYKNKYGGGGRGRGSGRGTGDSGRNLNRSGTPAGGNGGTYGELVALLRSLDNNSYPAFKSIESYERGWKTDGPDGFTIYVGRAQSDPYAPPTRCKIVVPSNHAAFPRVLHQNKTQATAMADFIHRKFHSICLDLGADRGANSGNGKGGWSGPKGGNISIESPSQHVLEQSAVCIDPVTGDVTAHFTVNLPARGRTILGRKALEIFEDIIPTLIKNSLIHAALDPSKLEYHVLSVEDQHWLRNQLKSRGLVAFIPNRAILPRASGADDKPMENKRSSSGKVVRFESPEPLQVSFDLPNLKKCIDGMGIRTGINLIVGGGFHGKSTLLSALQFGIYDKIPGDGREFCVCDETAVKIRAEDGRAVTAVDISPFISNLPFGKMTNNFTSADASGSTSQASNIIESLEIGSKLLLLDEDTCATNFMIRDSKMMELVAADQEPITPFIKKVEALHKELDVSTILVVGGSGDYFNVATTVIMMNCYKCIDVTDKAKAIAENSNQNNGSMPFGSFSKRFPQAQVLHETNKVSVRSQSLISYGDTELDLRYLEQVVTRSQTSSISLALTKIKSLASSDGTKTMKEVVDILIRRIKKDGLDILSPGSFHGGLAYVRPYEIAAAINRLRRENSITQIN